MKANRSLLESVIRSSGFSTFSKSTLPNTKWTVDHPKPATVPKPPQKPATVPKPPQKPATVPNSGPQKPATVPNSGPQKPQTIKWTEQLCNTASFIGTVMRPVKRFDMGDRYGSCTTLLVKPPSNPNHSFRILLKMWDEMADISLEHIKENDLLHVSGHVESFTKTAENNIPQTFYQVVVKEINYVAESEHIPTNTKAEQKDSGGDFLEKNRARLRVWQLLFTNPSEWYDYRTKKKNPKHPDFKHKDTGEALWINPHDPPWVKNQLQLLDSNSRKQNNKEDSSSKFSSFV